MRTILEIPKVGAVFGKLTVSSIHTVADSKGYKRVAVDLICECGGTTKNQRLGHLYGSPAKPGIKSCKQCVGINRGLNLRKTNDSQSKNAVYGRYKSSARQRNIKWDLSKEDFFSIVSLPCNYCDNTNTSFFSGVKSSPWVKSFRFTGIDRIDNNIGYVLNNIQACCKWCNYAKSDRDEKDFEKWILIVAKKIQNRKVDK
jgi:hypothetical protein